MRTFLFLSFICVTLGVFGSDIYTMQSPDGKISLTVQWDTNLSYSVSYQGKTLIFNSPLGFEFENESPMHADFTPITQPVSTLKHDSWEPVVRNKHEKINLHWNEVHLPLVEKGGKKRKMDLFFRLYDNGVAFRYQLYGGEVIGNRTISRELTGFTVPEPSHAWVAQYEARYTSSQESEFNKLPVNSLTTETVAGLPFLIEVDKENYLAITEADIDNYPGFYMGCDNNANDGQVTLTTKLSPLHGQPETGAKVRFSDKTHTPWRVIMIGNNPGHFIESEIIQGLNPPCAIQDPSWIKPGLSAWDHWWSGEVKMEMPVIKEYIDFAAAQGWPYMLIDWQWYGPFNQPEADITKPAPQLNMPEILAYARQKNVRCWLWLYSTDANRNNAFEEAFALYQQWGIAGIKIDFMDRDDQDMVNWYRKVIKKAAEHQLMVDFHGSYKPDGIERTWPNMMTREGVLGEEYSKFSSRIVPSHNVTLAFTRMLAGPMDYTPGGFLNVSPDGFKMQSPTMVINTRCAELSKFVIYESPFTVFCDHPKHVLGQPGADFLQIVPTVWDDTRFIDGYPGEFIVMAKRSGNQWFLVGMNNETPRNVTIATDFLPTGKYELEYWEDAKDAEKNPTKLNKKTVTIQSGKPIKIRMVSGGGYVSVLKPLMDNSNIRN